MPLTQYHKKQIKKRICNFIKDESDILYPIYDFKLFYDLALYKDKINHHDYEQLTSQKDLSLPSPN